MNPEPVRPAPEASEPPSPRRSARIMVIGSRVLAPWQLQILLQAGAVFVDEIPKLPEPEVPDFSMFAFDECCEDDSPRLDSRRAVMPPSLLRDSRRPPRYLQGQHYKKEKRCSL